MDFELVKENLELKLSLYQAQAQILSLQGEKLDRLYAEAKQELDALISSKSQEPAKE